jgi:hypothetical protein
MDKLIQECEALSDKYGLTNIEAIGLMLCERLQTLSDEVHDLDFDTDPICQAVREAHR